jgi:D-alanyl-D-alanine carboxypeptidase/D-alanyl-D-alanine-endopeptidase (penicillin-binding protein 4)
MNMNDPARLMRAACLAGVLLFGIAGTVRAGVESQIRSILTAADLRQTEVSVMAIDADTGQTIVEINADAPMIPASNMKLVTTAAALRVLGPDFMFNTELNLVGNDPDAATLVVVGDGDPSFGDPKMLAEHGYDVEQLLGAWVDAAKNAGVRRVGSLVIDDRVFDDQWVHPDWPVDQLNQWYCAQVSGLNFHDNCLDLYLEPGSAGHSPVVTMQPDSPFIETLNRARTGDADTFWVSRPMGSNRMTYRGEVKTRRTKPVHVTIDDPAMYFGQLLAHRLTRAGIAVNELRRPAPMEEFAAAVTLHRIQSALPVVLTRCNKDSQNMFAEALLKRMGHRITSAPGTWASGAAAMRQFLHERLGPDGAAITIADGSGMSRDNRVTARILAGLLVAMHRDETLGPQFIETLSLGGEDGTLQRRFVRGMHGQVYGKSGYINQVSALSGYIVFTPEGDDDPSAATRTIVFSMLFNGFKPPIYNHRVKEVQNELVRLIDELTAPADTEVSFGG